MSASARLARSAGGDRSGSVAALVTVLVAGTSVALTLTAETVWQQATSAPVAFLTFLAVTVALAVAVVEVYGRGAVSFAGAGMLAVGFAFGVGPAMAVAAAATAVTAARRRAAPHKAMFDIANLAAATAAGTLLYHALADPGSHALYRVLPAVAAGMAHLIVNVGLLCTVMSLAEGASVVAVWKERFRWFTPYYLASGPLALALAIAYERIGIAGLLAFALPPAFMMLSVRQYLARTRAAVEETRVANAALSARNRDVGDLFQFAGGLAASVRDRGMLTSYVEESVSRLAGGRARLSLGPDAEGTPLLAGGARVGCLAVEQGPGSDPERWSRLRDAIVPHVATAVETVQLIEQVRRQHVATIAALSRSMEAKDHYTGGHTERVSTLASALARRLGYSGADLDAVEIGSLLHDIGKIGIPERILRKEGPLDEDEWKVMKEHPLMSEYILSGTELPPTVLEIARSSHERVDGTGYPDGKKGDEIPLHARIVLVADAFDALTSDRPYRRGRHVGAAMTEIRANTGTQFCPTVVAALERVYREEPEFLGAGPLRAVESGAA